MFIMRKEDKNIRFLFDKVLIFNVIFRFRLGFGILESMCCLEKFIFFF